MINALRRAFRRMQVKKKETRLAGLNRALYVANAIIEEERRTERDSGRVFPSVRASNAKRKAEIEMKIAALGGKAP